MTDSNSYSEVSTALEPFIALARESGAQVTLVHHTGRGDRQGVDALMGSTEFAVSEGVILIPVIRAKAKQYAGTRNTEHFRLPAPLRGRMPMVQ